MHRKDNHYPTASKANKRNGYRTSEKDRLHKVEMMSLVNVIFCDSSAPPPDLPLLPLSEGDRGGNGSPDLSRGQVFSTPGGRG